MQHGEEDVLIVDDEPGVCWALAHILSRSGFSSITASTGQEALSVAQQSRLRLVFVDAKLPDIDGIELARHLRQINADASIVLISGFFYRDDEEVRQAVATGTISGFLSKPFLHDEVRRIVSHALA